MAAVSPRAVDKRARPGNEGGPPLIGPPTDFSAVTSLGEPAAPEVDVPEAVIPEVVAEQEPATEKEKV
ncbi:hypothetical protein [Kribbella sp. VKM Ac-2568]|uniref:hypothetical protein n=1 Tax=Kribbella sp. VKM Ac-2568 TaxID=2512219 RepID=UPI0010459677|nr:hypothetical protein [Kribbella sp. VKM Ac-2568]TCM45713.1 hypothetical protein EV648_106175 [Kribbella sp. VKM Ac-2568]